MSYNTATEPRLTDQHGIKRFHLSEEAKKAKLQREQQQIKNYRQLTQSVLENKKKKVYDDRVFKKTTELLNVNPEFYTVWNYRRDIIIHHYMATLPQDELANLFNEELVFNMMKFKQYPKVYWIWNHRTWLLQHHPEVNWMNELGLVEKIHAQDPRNFHGWAYRRYIITQLPETDELLQRELLYTLKMINNNFGNFSAWHYRSKLIPRLISRGLIDKSFVGNELNILHNAIYTDPQDQSGFMYLRWFLTCDLFKMDPEEHTKIIQEELAVLQELNELEKDDGKENCWCLQLIVIFRGLVVQSDGSTMQGITECLDELIKVDPLRKNRYRDLISGL
jgi:geranylgeranyl transferase type-2 subunit alpha